jgi:UDP-N-acetylmuramyl pentapeptide phosphotransferase/UDP-N-acetylglucosamine-1-phosphate transferase
MSTLNYIILFVALLMLENIYVMVARRFSIVDKPHLQSSHTGIVVRGGGCIVYVAFLLWSFINDFPDESCMLGLTLLAAVSFADDNHNVSPKVRLTIQFVAVLLMIYHTEFISLGLFVVLLTTVALVGIINIYNFMDGINGMMGGYSLIVALSLFYVNEYQIHFVDTTLLAFIICALLVFNIFNFRKTALCFAGDVGSLSSGFILIYLIMLLSQKTENMSWLAMIVVYGVDGGLTIIHRILLRDKLLEPHKKHAYQIMANELKMPHLLVSGIYMGLQALCSIWLIAFPGYLTLCLQVVLLSVAYLLFMKKYYYLHVVSI